MLILTRKLGEGIAIGDKVRIKVLGIRGRQVRLGIDAPADVIVHREEIFLKIQAANQKPTSAIADIRSSIVGTVKKKITGNDTPTASSS